MHRPDLFKHKEGGWGSAVPYESPYLLEILSTRSGAPGWASATGSLTAEAPGMQVVSCSRASSGYCLGDDGLLHLLGANDVRVEPLGLLVEPTSTNAVAASNDLNDAFWTLSGTSGSKNVVSPDGTANSAWTLTCTAGNSIHRVYNTALAISNGRNSVYVKRGTVDFFGLWLGATSTGAVFDLSDGTVAIDNGVNAIIAPVGSNGWYRCSIAGGGTFFMFSCADTAAHADGDVAWTAAGTETALVWQMQCDQGLTVATSPIITTGVTASRAADVLTVSNPLAAFGTPTTWRASARVAPAGDYDWSYMANYGSLIAAPDDGAASEWALYTRRELFGLDYYADSAANSFAQGPNVMRTGTGFYVALATVGGGNMNVYEDGVLAAGPNATSGTLTQNATLRLGSATGGGIASVYPMHLTDIYVDNT